jgi:pimeloyl-ACP methyl ester carboxylesterase
VLDQVCQGPQLIIGSSMGVWITLLAALARTDRVKAIMGIAGAPDFTEDLMYNKATPEVLAHMQEHGVYHHQTRYEDEEPFPITMQLIEDGRKNLLLRDSIRLNMPMHLVHGFEDLDVPWETSLAIMEQVTSHDVTLQLIKEGDHRLASDKHMQMLIQELELFIARITNNHYA